MGQIIHIYSFLDFVLKPDELSLYHKKNRLELGLKGYKLLVTLVENQGKLVPKDDLIASAWNSQIVTDGTLNKQIERIRLALSEFYPEEPVIETVRGIGYKFLPQVKVLNDRKKALKKWQKAIASVSVIPLVILLYFYPFGHQDQTNDLKNNEPAPYNIAVIPSAQGSDYLNQGGLNFLSELLVKNPRIYGLSPKSSWFMDEDKNKLAIELEDQKSLDFVLFVNLQEDTNENIATLELRNSNQFSKKAMIKSSSIKQLFADINSWVLTQLEIEDQSSQQNIENLSHDSFAVESFLRGKKESSARNYKKAIQYFDTAIAQDSGFVLAMLEKIYAQIKSNDYVAAESLIKTIEAGKQLNNDLRLSLLINKASLYVNTLRSSEVKPFIEEAIQLAENSGDSRKLIFALFYQGEMFKEMGEIEKSIDSTLKQQAVLKSNSKDNSDLMRVANNLAHAYYEINQFQQAKEQITPAIEYFEKTNHLVGMINSYTLLASIYYELSDYANALIAINKALALKSRVEDKHLVLYLLDAGGYIQMANGLHDECRKTIRELESLSSIMNLEYPLHLSKILKLSLDVATKNLTTLNEDAKVLDTMTQSLEGEFLFVRQSALSRIINANILLENFDIAESQLQELKTIVKNTLTQGDSLYQTSWLNLQLQRNPDSDAGTKLVEIMTKFIQSRRYRQAIDVAIILLEKDEKDGFLNSDKILNQIQHLNPFPYPYLKYKAILTAHQGDYFNAAKLMQEMKKSSNEWWKTDDQLLLEEYLNEVKNQ
ncbi:MAG TPA: winged helix-turn-helix domain-containing protein [Gammaproteobacteria bacterium]|nr:winged helix-turn-helix domain-containing protein [Xanthomonadales bacterium]HPI96552.1 winged helix-turn-helix domain-containing protein [Gammaproteobacteria bacterium]